MGNIFEKDAWEIIRDKTGEKRPANGELASEEEVGKTNEETTEKMEMIEALKKGSSFAEVFEKYEKLSDGERIGECNKRGIEFNLEGSVVSIRRDSEAAKYFANIIMSEGDAGFVLDEKLSKGNFYVFERRIPYVPDSYCDDGFQKAA